MDWVRPLVYVTDAVVATALLLCFGQTYNRFHSPRNSAEATLGQIRIAAKKRLDMTEELVEIVRTYAKLERDSERSAS